MGPDRAGLKGAVQKGFYISYPRNAEIRIRRCWWRYRVWLLDHSRIGSNGFHHGVSLLSIRLRI